MPNAAKSLLARRRSGARAIFRKMEEPARLRRPGRIVLDSTPSLALAPGPAGSAIIAALKEAHVTTVAALPDIWTSAGLLWPLSRDPAFRLIRVCKEDEAISICSGLAYCDQRAVASMQSTGFQDSINAIRAIAVGYQQPICMLVGLLQRDLQKPLDDTQIYDVRVVLNLLTVLEIDYFFVDGPEDVAKIAPAVETAYAHSKPVIMLITRPVAVA
jgi:sulfopyruvate decarboxylase subunit alpha